MSPEQAREDTNIDGRTDIYSLGATLYHMLTGAPPYLGGSSVEVMSMHLTQPVPDARKSNPGISEYASALISKAMAKDRSGRHATAREFADDVEALLSGEPLTLADPPAPAPAPPATAAERHVEPIPAPPTTWEEPPPELIPVPPAGTVEPQAKPVLSGGKIAALAAGFVILAIIGIYALRPSSEPEPKKVSEDARAFAVVEEWVTTHPGRYAEALAKYELLKSTSTDPLYKKKAEDALRSLETARTRTADTVFDRLKTKADELKRSGAYSAAVSAYRSVPPEFQGILRVRITQAVAALDAEASAKIKLGLDRARALLEKGDATAGMRELHKIATIQHVAFMTELHDLRKELEQAGFKQAVAARKKINRLLHSVDAPAMKGDLRGAASITRAATRDPELACIKSSVEALARIGAALLKAEALPNRSLAASTPDEHIAAAILALAAEDPDKMGAALKHAGNHEFLTHYAIELRQLKERLQERLADQQQRQQMRLTEFRGTLATTLKKRRYEQALSGIDAIIADPLLPHIRDNALADRRALSKLAAVMKRIRSNVRTEAMKTTETKTPTRHRGIPATVEAYDPKTDKVTFSGGRSDSIAIMRAADLKALFELSPGQPAAHQESLALLFAAEGERQKARGHLAHAAKRADVEHLIKILGKVASALPAGDNDDPDTSAEVMAKLTPQEREDLQAALAKNRELFNNYWRIVGKQRDTHKKRYQKKLSGEWSRIEREIRALEDCLETGYHYYYDYWHYYYYYRSRAQLQRHLANAKRKRTRLATRTRLGLAVISKRAAKTRVAIRTVMLRNKRRLLMGKEITEGEMSALYEKEVARGR